MAKSVTELAKLRRHWYCILHSASSTHPLALPPWQDLSLNWVFHEAGPDVREVVVFVVLMRLSIVTWLLHDMLNSTMTHNVETISIFDPSGHVLMIVLLIHTPSSGNVKVLREWLDCATDLNVLVLSTVLKQRNLQRCQRNKTNWPCYSGKRTWHFKK